jgi:Cdc6-like AAA superfamily ATPase
MPNSLTFWTSVIILDEISDKCKNSHQLVKEMFQWVSNVKRHPLVVIGVANVLIDVSEAAFRGFVKCTLFFLK